MTRPLVLGVLNVTPDSFSDGGEHFSAERAIAHGLHMNAQGADIIDIGGESTRPGAVRVDAEEELRRVLPVVNALTGAGVPVSIDTMRAEVARECVMSGACIVNDVSGGLADPDMYTTVAELKVPYVVMHWRGHGAEMNDRATYADVVEDVIKEVRARLVEAQSSGVSQDRIIIDPGLGFAKEADDNWQLLTELREFLDLGYHVLIGASRKRFLGSLLSADTGVPRAFADRDAATAAVSALAAASGVWGVRVHDVSSSLDAVRVGQAWALGRQP